MRVLRFGAAIVAGAACGGAADSELRGASGGAAGTAVAGGTGGESGVGGAVSSGAGGTAAGTPPAGTGGLPLPDASTLDSTVDAPATTDGAPPDAIVPPADATAEGNDPTKCPPTQPAQASPCNVLVNSTDCVYGFRHCVCTISAWLCVP